MSEGKARHQVLLTSGPSSVEKSDKPDSPRHAWGADTIPQERQGEEPDSVSWRVTNPTRHPTEKNQAKASVSTPTVGNVGFSIGGESASKRSTRKGGVKE